MKDQTDDDIFVDEEDEELEVVQPAPVPVIEQPIVEKPKEEIVEAPIIETSEEPVERPEAAPKEASIETPEVTPIEEVEVETAEPLAVEPIAPELAKTKPSFVARLKEESRRYKIKQIQMQAEKLNFSEEDLKELAKFLTKEKSSEESES